MPTSCYDCAGSGRVYVTDYSEWGRDGWRVCPECGGTGLGIEEQKALALKAALEAVSS